MIFQVIEGYSEYYIILNNIILCLDISGDLTIIFLFEFHMLYCGRYIIYHLIYTTLTDYCITLFFYCNVLKTWTKSHRLGC